jgi:Ca2+-binding RTX toxin-like protein
VLLMASGVALAATIGCRGGSCAGKPSDDTLFGNPRVANEFGLGGKDLMYGYESADQMSGDVGRDRMYGGIAADTVNGEGGADAVYGGPGNDTVVGNKGNDTLSADLGDDVIQAIDDQKDQINCAGGTTGSTITGPRSVAALRDPQPPVGVF